MSRLANPIKTVISLVLLISVLPACTPAAPPGTPETSPTSSEISTCAPSNVTSSGEFSSPTAVASDEKLRRANQLTPGSIPTVANRPAISPKGSQ